MELPVSTKLLLQDRIFVVVLFDVSVQDVWYVCVYGMQDVTTSYTNKSPQAMQIIICLDDAGCC